MLVLLLLFMSAVRVSFSCTPFSCQGFGCGVDDSCSVDMIAWAGLRVHVQESKLVIENVAGILDRIMTLIGFMYYCDDHALLNPSTSCIPYSRPREFYVCRHRKLNFWTGTPLSRFQRRFVESCVGTWRSMFWLHLLHPSNPSLLHVLPGGDDLREELRWPPYVVCHVTSFVFCFAFRSVLCFDNACLWKSLCQQWMSAHNTHAYCMSSLHS